MTRMTRPSYRTAIQWLAENDGPGDTGEDAESAGETVAAMLVTDMFGVDEGRVGRDVVRARARSGE